MNLHLYFKYLFVSFSDCLSFYCYTSLYTHNTLQFTCTHVHVYTIWILIHVHCSSTYICQYTINIFYMYTFFFLRICIRYIKYISCTHVHVYVIWHVHMYMIMAATNSSFCIRIFIKQISRYLLVIVSQLISSDL